MSAIVDNRLYKEDALERLLAYVQRRHAQQNVAFDGRHNPGLDPRGVARVLDAVRRELGMRVPSDTPDLVAHMRARDIALR